jgi:hypothetical protein
MLTNTQNIFSKFLGAICGSVTRGYISMYFAIRLLLCLSTWISLFFLRVRVKFVTHISAKLRDKFRLRLNSNGECEIRERTSFFSRLSVVYTLEINTIRDELKNLIALNNYGVTRRMFDQIFSRRMSMPWKATLCDWHAHNHAISTVL